MLVMQCVLMHIFLALKRHGSGLIGACALHRMNKVIDKNLVEQLKYIV